MPCIETYVFGLVGPAKHSGAHPRIVVKIRWLDDHGLMTVINDPAKIRQHRHMGMPAAQQDQVRHDEAAVYLTQTSGSNDPGVMYSIR